MVEDVLQEQNVILKSLTGRKFEFPQFGTAPNQVTSRVSHTVPRLASFDRSAFQLP